MRRSTGAIFRETRPETIITSACRGEARKTSAPKRARSLRELVAFIISMAQQASPNVAGQRDDLRAQLISESSRVVNTSGNASAIIFSRPIATFAPSGGSSNLCVAFVGRGQQAGLSFSFTARALAPVESTLLQHVHVARQQERDEDHHFAIQQHSQTVLRRRQ